VRKTCGADGASLARDGRVECDSLPRARPRHDYTGELVTEHERALERGVADRAFGDPMAVGAAQPDRGDVHEDLPLARDDVRLLVQAKIAHTV
jgi:hypothetical protein